MSEQELAQAKEALADAAKQKRKNSNMMYWLEARGQKGQYEAMSPSEKKPDDVWRDMWRERCTAQRQQELAREQKERSGQFDKLTRAEAYVETVLAPPGKTPQQSWRKQVWSDVWGLPMAPTPGNF